MGLGEEYIYTTLILSHNVLIALLTILISLSFSSSSPGSVAPVPILQISKMVHLTQVVFAGMVSWPAAVGAAATDKKPWPQGISLKSFIGTGKKE